jgi:hypothetical protein
MPFGGLGGFLGFEGARSARSSWFSCSFADVDRTESAGTDWARSEGPGDLGPTHIRAGYTGSDAPPWDSSDTRPWSRPRPEVTRAVSRGSHADFERDMRA